MLSFNVKYKGRKINVKLTHEESVFTLLEGEPIEIFYFDRRVLIKPGENILKGYEEK
ncbi:MAG: Trehalose and maltose hydrolases (Possible phosphorylases) [Caldanaerobacter subterraneus]|nr:MAG: Trehalose and maltose hydrolases (Possible phosphorylases) [Caldanaerobacter subterraneus]